MRNSILIYAANRPALLPRVLGILHRQRLSPALVHAEAIGAGTLRIFLEVDCDKRRLGRLLGHCEKISGVQSVVSIRLDGLELPAMNPRLASPTG